MTEAGPAGRRRLLQVETFFEAEDAGQVEELVQHQVICFESPVQIQLQILKLSNYHLSEP